MAHLQCVNSLSILVEVKLQKHVGGCSKSFHTSLQCLEGFFIVIVCLFTPIRSNYFPNRAVREHAFGLHDFRHRISGYDTV